MTRCDICRRNIVKYSSHPVLSSRHRAHSQNNRRHVAYVRKAVDSELDPTDGPSILTVK